MSLYQSAVDKKLKHGFLLAASRATNHSDTFYEAFIEHQIFVLPFPITHPYSFIGGIRSIMNMWNKENEK